MVCSPHLHFFLLFSLWDNTNTSVHPVYLINQVKRNYTIEGGFASIGPEFVALKCLLKSLCVIYISCHVL